jgi:hypothetical protein
MMARIETPRGPCVMSAAARTPAELIELDLTSTPSRGLGYGQDAGGGPEISGAQNTLMMDKIRDLERDRDVLREKNDIGGALMADQNQMQQILTEHSKRERTEKESSEEPILVKVDGLKYEDDNHSVWCWEARRLYKQPKHLFAGGKVPL